MSTFERYPFTDLLATSILLGSCITNATGPAIAVDIAEPDDNRAAGRVLGARLVRMNPFDATTIASIIALSPYVGVRHALADALAQPFPLVGDDFILDHLAIDADAGVREAAESARATRGMPAPPTRAPPPPPSPRRVLVIDDYPGGRAALCATLNELGYDAMCGPSGVTQHDVPWRELVDVVITNHDPPWTDSTRVISDLRRHAPELPAVVLREPEAAPRAPCAGHDREITLVRPFRIEDLHSVIDRCSDRGDRA